MSSVGYRAWRLRRMEEDPHCYWCGREVIECGEQYGRERGPVLPNMATVDHLYSRLTEHRANGNRGKWVLACYECNHERARQEHLVLALEERRKLSKRKGDKR